MDCNTARQLMTYLLSQEGLGPEDAAAIEQHLNSCSTCAAIASNARTWDAGIGAVMRDVIVPHDLRARVLTRLAVQRATIWRKQMFRVSAAAAVLLAVILGASMWWSRKAEIDLASFALQRDEYFVRLGNPDLVVDEFRSHGIRMQFPPGFDTALLSDYDVAQYDSRTVARLAFQRDNFRARVYILPKRHFRLPRDPELMVPASSCRVEVIDGHGDFYFVIVYEGDATRQHFRRIGEVVG